MLLQLEVLAKRAGLQILDVEPYPRLESFFRSLGYESVPGSVELGGYHLIRLSKRVAV